MIQKKIKYQEGFKYQLTEDYSIQTKILGYEFENRFIKLTLDGLLTLKEGWAWNGVSGFKDIKKMMRASCVHDSIYWLINYKVIPKSYKHHGDKLFEEICIEDKLDEVFADWAFNVIDKLGVHAARPGRKRPVLEAP